MGLYAGRNGGFDAAAVAELMRPAVEAWYNARIVIRDPDTLNATPYDPVADTGGDAEPVTIWDSGDDGALVQPIRTQTLGDFGAQAVGLVAVRIQCSPPDDVRLKSGYQIVVSGGNDPELTRHLYVIAGGIDSSIRWVTRLTAMVVAG